MGCRYIQVLTYSRIAIGSAAGLLLGEMETLLELAHPATHRLGDLLDVLRRLS